MPTPLEKARKAPDSMKGRILRIARRVFGEYGYHGATTRMIAEEVGIDISTLYYPWGEKSDLYEGVILDVHHSLKQRLKEVEKVIRGLPLEQRMDIAIEMMTEYLFANPEISNIILFRYFGKTRDEAILDFYVPELAGDIALSMGLCSDRKTMPKDILMKVMAMSNAIHNFVSGESFFRSTLDLPRDEYLSMVKETLKFILIPAFTAFGSDGGT